MKDRRKERALKLLDELQADIDKTRMHPPERYSDEWKKMGEIYGWCALCCEPNNLCDGTCLSELTR